MAEPTSVKDDLNGALRTLVNDLRANRPAAPETVETWCFERTENIQFAASAHG